MERNTVHPALVPGSRLNNSTVWDDLKARLEGLPPLEQLKQANSFWNRWPYRLDPDAYGKPDYWAAPYEFVKNSGDCEDYSIAKYYTLRELGFAPEVLRIVVVMETVRNIAHAVLVVYLDGEAYVLDNLSANVLPHTRLRNYVPQFSVNEEFRWAHVRPK
jgi:predicted transglutaminase-like cysteine proteinase